MGDLLNPQLYGYEGANNTFLAFDEAGFFGKSLQPQGIFFKTIKLGYTVVEDSGAFYVFTIDDL